MKISRTELVQALQQVKGAVAQKGFVPILTHVHIAGGAVLGYDSEIGIKAKLTTSIEPGFNVKADRFLALLERLEEEDIELTVTKERITIACGRHTSHLQQIQEEFPKPTVTVKPEDWKEVPAGFKEAVERCLLGVSGDENNRALSSLYVAGDKVYGGDGKQIVRCTVPGLDVAPFMLPKKAVSELIRLGNPKRVAVRDNLAVFDYVNLTFLARLRDGAEYPQAQFDSLFTKIGERTVTPLPDGLPTALVRLSLLTAEPLKAVWLACKPLGLELSLTSQSASGFELLAPEGATFPRKGMNADLAGPLLAYAENWGPGDDATSPFYFTGETAGYEALLAPLSP